MVHTIPIMRPKLPSAARLAPYLESIDASQIYSNYGPHVLSLEDRLAAHYSLDQGTVGTVANATLGLAIALAAQRQKRGTLCMMPAWTFVASAHAAVMAGFIPYFVDVSPVTWALDVDQAADEIARAPGEVGAIMPVMPFGTPMDSAAWDRFRQRTGIAVVIDGAAAFDSIVPAATPTVVSLHATKIFGTGEGGFVISTDRSMRSEVRTRANFGFDGSREARVAAFNAKLSEYHAAIGHAGLDEWSAVRAEWDNAAKTYRRSLGQFNHVSLQQGFGESWVSSTCVLKFSQPVADDFERALADREIETRRWWSSGAHSHPATADYPHARVPETDVLVRSTLAVPFYRDINPTQINRIVEVINDTFGRDGA